MTAFAPFALPPPSPLDLENEARAALCQALGLTVTVRAPTWRQVLFGGKPIDFEMPTIPGAVLDRISTAEAQGPGSKLLGTIQRARPSQINPRTVAASKPLPLPKDAVSSWKRLVFLITSGPSVLRLLTAAGYLTPKDVDAIEDAYPAGLDEERTGSVEAAMALTNAAMRNKQEPDVANWLNDQLLTLMDEHRPIEFLSDLLSPAQQAQPGPSPGNGQSVVAQQNQPIVDTGRAQ